MTKVPVGFEFAEAATLSFDSPSAFSAALRRQRESYAFVPAEGVSGISVDGYLEGQSDGLRVTREAASQLCSIVSVPPAFLMQLARRNEPLAQEVLRDAVAATNRDDLHMLVDTASGRVDGFTVKPYVTAESDRVFNMALSAAPRGELTGGWINGTFTRATIVGEKNIDVRRKESKVGDILRAGFELTNDIGIGGITVITDYVHRLRCTNGMLSTDVRGCEKIPHRATDEGTEHRIAEAIVAASTRSLDMVELSRIAARTFFDLPTLQRAQRFISNPQNGGSTTLLKQATQTAAREATADGRTTGEVSLWDFVNGVTEAARSATSITRRRAVESLGYNLMVETLDAL